MALYVWIGLVTLVACFVLPWVWYRLFIKPAKDAKASQMTDKRP